MKKANANKKSLMKIAVATMVAIFSLASAFAGTVAWFTSNQTISASGMSFRVAVDRESFSNMTIHRCDLSNSTSEKLVFFSEPAVTVDEHGATVETEMVQMDNYSTLNQTQPVLFLFTLDANTYEDDITITCTSDNATFTSLITANNVGHFPFSSASAFKSRSYSGNSFPFNNVPVNSLGARTTFVQINGQNTPTYNQSIDIFAGTEHNYVDYIAVILDYYGDAIEYIQNLPANSNYASIAAQHNDSCISFYCDWTLKM